MRSFVAAMPVFVALLVTLVIFVLLPMIGGAFTQF